MSDETAPTTPVLPTPLPTDGTATITEIATAINGLISYAGSLPTSEAAPLTDDQLKAITRVEQFFK